MPLPPAMKPEMHYYSRKGPSELQPACLGEHIPAEVSPTNLQQCQLSLARSAPCSQVLTARG